MSVLTKNVEVRGTLHMVLARLDADPRTAEEWDAIREALDDCERYAAKCAAMRRAISERPLTSAQRALLQELPCYVRGSSVGVARSLEMRGLATLTDNGDFRPHGRVDGERWSVDITEPGKLALAPLRTLCGDEVASVCPRCLDETPGKPAGDPERPHPGPFTSDLCGDCEAASRLSAVAGMARANTG